MLYSVVFLSALKQRGKGLSERGFPWQNRLISM
jgi:hypothetical protein